MSLDTPAGRLLAIFDQLRAVEVEFDFRQLWAAALGYQAGSPTEVAHMAEVATLLRQVHVVAVGVAKSGSGYDESALLHEYPSWSAAVFGWNVASGNRYRGISIVSNTARDALSATHSILRAAAREGVFPEQSRDDLLSQVRITILQLLDEVSSEDRVPESLRVHLTALLVEVHETVIMVQYRGDQAVASSLQRAEGIFDDAANPDRHRTDSGRSWLQERLEEWATTIRNVSLTVCGALTTPTAAIYYMSTRDPIGTTLIIASSNSQFLGQAMRQLAQAVGQPEGEPRAIENKIPPTGK